MRTPPEIPIRLFQSQLHECGYYPERQARNLVLDPDSPYLARAYTNAVDHGFRRSSAHVYRPHCPQCDACVASRIDVARFQPDRNQRRCLTRNADLEIQTVPGRYHDDAFQLYARYLGARHGDGPMANPSAQEFERFLVSDWGSTVFIEFRLKQELLAVAVTDVLPQGLSAVYTFYAPEQPRRSLGTFAILQQIALAQRRNLPFVYLGYWLAGHPKMDYKQRFSALQVLREGHWRELR